MRTDVAGKRDLFEELLACSQGLRSCPATSPNRCLPDRITSRSSRLMTPSDAPRNLHVIGLQRLPQQGIVNQVNHPDREVVAPRINQSKFVGAKGTLLRNAEVGRLPIATSPGQAASSRRVGCLTGALHGAFWIRRAVSRPSAASLPGTCFAKQISVHHGSSIRHFGKISSAISPDSGDPSTPELTLAVLSIMTARFAFGDGCMRSLAVLGPAPAHRMRGTS